MGKKLSLDDFIRRSNEKHGGKYDYSQSDISGGVHKPLKIGIIPFSVVRILDF